MTIPADHSASHRTDEICDVAVLNIHQLVEVGAEVLSGRLWVLTNGSEVDLVEFHDLHQANLSVNCSVAFADGGDAEIDFFMQSRTVGIELKRFAGLASAL